MITAEYAQMMARYNRWMNEKVYAASDRLSDEERKADRGAFFKSIHSSLNHLLWADYMWLSRFVKGTALAKDYPQGAAGVDIHSDWEQLKAARAELDADLCVWAASLDPAWLAADFTWYSGFSKSNRTRPASVLVAHLFNHQTHHRGQVTTLLSQQGIDPGDTDLMLLPD
ncbi:MAG: DinB family protein [Pseudomonadota bacterium]